MRNEAVASPAAMVCQKNSQPFGIGDQGKEIHQFGAARHLVDDVADRVLHPAVRKQDPERGQVRADRHQPDRSQVHLFGHASLAEDPHAEERGFEEERQQRLDGERRAEDVAHVAGILRPVHAELEFLHDAGHHPDGEVDEEQFSPELCHLAIVLVAGLIVARLHVRHEPPQPERERNKEKVIDSRQTELPS
jgi:hypothetical protein